MNIKHLVTALTLTAISSAALALPIYNTITVYDSSNSVLATVSSNATGTVTYLPGIAVNPEQWGNYGTVVDSNNNVLGVFGIATGGPDFVNLAFSIDYWAPPQNEVYASGAPISLTKYLDPSLQLLGDTAYLTAAVPEPESYALMLAGLGSLAAWSRRHSRPSA